MPMEVCSGWRVVSFENMGCIHAQIFQLNEWVKQGKYQSRVVEDGYFSKNPNIRPLIDQGIHVITRLCTDGVGHFDPPPKKEKTKGRPRKYGNKIKIADIWKTCEHKTIEVNVYGKRQVMEVATEEVWTLELSQKVKAVVFKGNNGKLISLISTDVSLDATQIIEIYGARFSIEIAIRDVKQHLGFEDYQHQGLFAAIRFLHLVGVAHNIGKTVLIKCAQSEWLKVPQNEGDTPWTSELSFSKLHYPSSHCFL